MLTALSAGCAKIEQSMDEASNHLIGYEVVENQPVTKAVFPTDQTFMSTAYELASGRTWDANSAQATPYFNNNHHQFSSTFPDTSLLSY